MSYIKVSTIKSATSKCIRFDETYTKCELITSKIDKLPHILGLYDTIEALELTVDGQPQTWKITRPLDTIKYLSLKARTAFRNRPEMLPENFWLMFPNLEAIITEDVFLPVANLDALLNLNTCHLTYGVSKVKKTTSKVNELIQVLTNMTTLTDLKIHSHEECHIPDELFQNNPNLQFISFYGRTRTDNIPSILNCNTLRKLRIAINLVDNQYILELSNLEAFLINLIGSDQIPDDFFAKPIFMTCTTKLGNLHSGYDGSIINPGGENAKKYFATLPDSAVPKKHWCDTIRYIANYNFSVYNG